MVADSVGSLCAGAGGLGDATLHHVYSENTGTGEITRAVRHGQLEQSAAGVPAVAPSAVASKGGRRRSSIARHSLMTQVIAEEAATPAEPATARAEPADAAALNITEDMAISPDRTRDLTAQQEQETPGDSAIAGQDLDGMTTNLLLDDRSVGGWGHVISARAPETTGRGSVGSNVPTIHGLVSTISGSGCTQWPIQHKQHTMIALCRRQRSVIFCSC